MIVVVAVANPILVFKLEVALAQSQFLFLEGYSISRGKICMVNKEWLSKERKNKWH